MEDNQSIELFWARNEDAIAQTDAAYGRKLYVLANRILNNREADGYFSGEPAERDQAHFCAIIVF